MGRSNKRRDRRSCNNSTQQHPLGYHGLVNQGATCYLNSVLQVLCKTEEFRKAVERPLTTNCKSEWIDHELNTLFRKLKKETATTHAITTHLGIMKVSEQCDAAECFEKILSHTSPEASQIFEGELINHNTCSICQTKTESSNTFWSIPLAMVDSDSKEYCVMNGIQSYFQESHIGGADQLYCDQCKNKADATIKLEMKHHPDVLTLLLKRFKFDYHVKKCVKIKSKVQIPNTLQIPPNEVQSLAYELYAYVDHVGELRHGHYTVTIKSHDKWYHFDDINVKLGNFQKQSQSAYLLFYRKVSATDAPKENISEVPASKACQQNISENNVDGDGGANSKGQKDMQETDGLAVPESKENNIIRVDNDSGVPVSHKSESQQQLSKNNQHFNVQGQNDTKIVNGGQSRCKQQEDIPKQNGLQPTHSNEQITHRHNRGVGKNQKHNQGFQLNSKKDEDATISNSQPPKSSMRNGKEEQRRDYKNRQTTEKPINPCSGSKVGQDNQHFNNVPKNRDKQKLQKIERHEQVESTKGEQQKEDGEHLIKGERKRKLSGHTDDVPLTNQSQNQSSQDELKRNNNTITGNKEAKIQTPEKYWHNNSEEELQRSNQNVGMESEREDKEINPSYCTVEQKVNNECYNNDDKHGQKVENTCCKDETIQKTVQLDIKPNSPQSDLDREKNMTLTQETEVKLESEAQPDPQVDELSSVFSQLTVKDSSESQGCSDENTSGNKDSCSKKHGLTETNPEETPQDSVKAGVKKDGSGENKRKNKTKGTVVTVAGLYVPKRQNHLGQK